ncbi:hypothetical protein L6164_012407 [Bauhinia variegata]|uniref:Uncharacterized protein n=1 Tax=Bauhinia variegata TaxID=167791 RepID=A0ACB9P8Z0_BAUVA|nr:hypothetical protein L6164_012407 [Bauhinia variegata]
MGEELDVKDKSTELLKPEGIRENELEVQLAEKYASLDKLKEGMNNLKRSEDHAMNLLSDCRRRIQQLEVELDKRKESEANLFDSLVMQTRELEQSKILLEESEVEITSLRERVEKLQGSASKNMTIPNPDESRNGLENGVSTRETVNGSETEVQREKDNSSVAQEDETLASEQLKTLLKEMSLLRNELKLATEAEENSKRAMDDLALALKEVAKEANKVKDQLNLSQLELEHSKGEAERLRLLLKSTEDNYKELLNETRKEANRYQNTTERLRLEAEDSLLAWNGKETEFVNCLKRAEDEKSSAQKNFAKLLESLREAESKIKESKEENQKLRDILKQALNEANVAKEAAGIARAENAELQDSLTRKEEVLNVLARENAMLKINEVASLENIKELKQLLAEATGKELKNKDEGKSSMKESSKKLGRSARTLSITETKETQVGKNLPDKCFSFKGLIIPYKQHKEGDDDALGGSIFDEACSSDSPISQQEIEALSLDDFDQVHESPFDDVENDRNSSKRRALLRRFGELIRVRSYQRKEQSIQ